MTQEFRRADTRVVDRVRSHAERTEDEPMTKIRIDSIANVSVNGMRAHLQGLLGWPGKVRGKWAYLYRALDKLGNTIDFYLSATRNTKAAKRFLGKALRGLKDWEQPEVLNTDKAPTYAAAIAEFKAEGKCPDETRHRQVKYLNNVVEADHGKLKLLIRPVRGFKTLKTAYATIKGFEVMRALRKGQAGIFALQDGIVGEARIVERAFGIGPCALTEVMALLQDHLANAEA